MSSAKDPDGGHGEKLTRKQELAIAALLSSPTIEAAAVQAGVAVATLRRWLKDAPFIVEYRTARRQVVEAAVGRLQQASGNAVEALSRNLNCGNAGNEIRAALGVLDQAYRGTELLDLAERLERLGADRSLFEKGQNAARNRRRRARSRT